MEPIMYVPWIIFDAFAIGLVIVAYVNDRKNNKK
jgi:hypothetical protein